MWKTVYQVSNAQLVNLSLLILEQHPPSLPPCILRNFRLMKMLGQKGHGEPLIRNVSKPQGASGNKAFKSYEQPPFIVLVLPHDAIVFIDFLILE